MGKSYASELILAEREALVHRQNIRDCRDQVIRIDFTLLVVKEAVEIRTGRGQCKMNEEREKNKKFHDLTRVAVPPQRVGQRCLALSVNMTDMGLCRTLHIRECYPHKCIFSAGIVCESIDTPSPAPLFCWM